MKIYRVESIYEDLFGCCSTLDNAIVLAREVAFEACQTIEIVEDEIDVISNGILVAVIFYSEDKNNEPILETYLY